MPDASTMDSVDVLKRIDEIEVRQEKANQMVSDLCHRRRDWIMSIPARPDHDPDLVISASLGDVTFLIEQLRPALADTRRVAKMRELLTQSFRCISPVPEGTPIQFLGVYVTRWNRTDEPTHGFIEWDDDSIDAAMAATPREN